MRFEVYVEGTTNKVLICIQTETMKRQVSIRPFFLVTFYFASLPLLLYSLSLSLSDFNKEKNRSPILNFLSKTIKDQTEQKEQQLYLTHRLMRQCQREPIINPSQFMNHIVAANLFLLKKFLSLTFSRRKRILLLPILKNLLNYASTHL